MISYVSIIHASNTKPIATEVTLSAMTNGHNFIGGGEISLKMKQADNCDTTLDTALNLDAQKLITKSSKQIVSTSPYLWPLSVTIKLPFITTQKPIPKYSSICFSADGMEYGKILFGNCLSANFSLGINADDMLGIHTLPPTLLYRLFNNYDVFFISPQQLSTQSNIRASKITYYFPHIKGVDVGISYTPSVNYCNMIGHECSRLITNRDTMQMDGYWLGDDASYYNVISIGARYKHMLSQSAHIGVSFVIERGSLYTKNIDGPIADKKNGMLAYDIGIEGGYMGVKIIASYGNHEKYTDVVGVFDNVERKSDEISQSKWYWTIGASYNMHKFGISISQVATHISRINVPLMMPSLHNDDRVQRPKYEIENVIRIISVSMKYIINERMAIFAEISGEPTQSRSNIHGIMNVNEGGARGVFGIILKM